ncbi:MAG: 4-hydroxy-3-methylbut-2-enyl diphosphate reductase [Rhodospirillaceae bacterium]|nr:4-hydroxy-3-methylbut-2-enyl diphosphate reductase [Rhodospirillaceae bacterium]
MNKPIKIILANPRGFCAGVDRAIEIVKTALAKFGKPIYVRHQIVHNKYVVEELESMGAIFVKSLDEVPENAWTVFSAHGVAEKVENKAKERGLPYIDAACPLVLKIHNQGQRAVKNNREVVLIGHAGHPEVEGTIGRIPGKTYLVATVDDVGKLDIDSAIDLSYLTQTTLSVDDTKDIIDALKEKFPNIEGPDLNGICYATQNRQSAARDVAKQVDLLLVVGAKNSSNSNRLCEIGKAEGVASYLIDDASMINDAWIDGVESIGITAGASAPEVLVEGVIDYLNQLGEIKIETLSGTEEDMHFNLPKELKD